MAMIGNKVPAGNGWTIQRIKLSKLNPAEDITLPYSMDRGYFKIRNPFGVVVDRALSVKVARKRVKQHQELRGLLDVGR